MSGKVQSSKPLEYTRTILFFLGCVLVMTCYCLSPKEIMSEQRLYTSAVSMAEVNNDTLALFDYKVYGTEERMQRGLVLETPGKIEQLRANDDILAVKIPGEPYAVQYFEDHILVTDPEVLELNIEFCVVKNVNFLNSSIPTRTFIKVARDLLSKIGYIYLGIISVLAFLVFTPLWISGTKSLERLISLYRKPNANEIGRGQ
mgnify:CR=1 FL=1